MSPENSATNYIISLQFTGQKILTIHRFYHYCNYILVYHFIFIFLIYLIIYFNNYILFYYHCYYYNHQNLHERPYSLYFTDYYRVYGQVATLLPSLPAQVVTSRTHSVISQHWVLFQHWSPLTAAGNRLLTCSWWCVHAGTGRVGLATGRVWAGESCFDCLLSITSGTGSGGYCD